MLPKLLAFLALPLICSAQEVTPASKNPLAGNAKAIEVGRNDFHIYCIACHGVHATGGRGGPDLTKGTFHNGDTDADLYRVISRGVAGSEMPGFSDLNSQDIWQLVAYIRSLERPNSAVVTGDRAAGEKLFWGKGSCGQCHRVSTRGVAIGPDLSRAGRQRSLDYLRESIVAPDADVTSGFATIVVVTRDGKKISGVEKGFDNFSAQLVDVSGKYHSYLKDDVTSLKREDRSLMPATYGKLFSERELNDLLAYLATLGGER